MAAESRKDEISVIARIRTDFPQKFGIPRQSGLVSSLQGSIIFEPDYRAAEAVRGLEGFEYLWLLWKFEDTKRDSFQPTVRPPGLGGNTQMGVFATRSPFRPNPIGLSSVRLEGIEITKENGPVIYVSGADLKDLTPIYDIKPYLPYTDSHPSARDGFAGEVGRKRLGLHFPEELLRRFPEEKRMAVCEILRQDPRPAYHTDGERRYGVAFAGFDVGFQVKDGLLTVLEVKKL